MRLLIVTALPVEARPVVQRLKMQGEASGAGGAPFRLYRRDDMALVVSGMGKTAAAAATSWAAARVLGSHAREEECLAFLNFGSAGHPHRAVGEVLLAHEVRDGGSGRKWFPPFCFALPCATDRVTTVDRIERAYGEETLYEMEASGFVETAQRFTTSELVHCVKFVSDNAEQRVEDLDLPRVGELAEASLDTLLELVGQVRALARTVEKSHSLPEVPDGLWQRWHFTVTQERQRHRLLSRWRALQPEQPLPEDLFSGARSSREALAVLEKAVEAAARR